MSEKGFVIRCPHCRKPNFCEDHPKDRVLSSKAEFEEILSDLTNASSRQEQENFSHKNLFRCQRSRWFCPASFEAFIFDDEKLALECLKSVSESWGANRKFQLYKADAQTKWDGKSEGKYFGILFNSQPVLRRREIELELIMDPELISHLISGICVEIGLPLTIFAANVFCKDKKLKTHWIPIEGYSQKPGSVPPLFSCFCKTAREIELEWLISKFENIGIDNCGYYDKSTGHCGMRDDVPACKRDPKDWVHCPAVMEVRSAEDPCYNSDLELIDKVGQSIEQEETIKNGIIHECPVGLHEIAFPIRTHDFWVGVAMTGQVFFDVDKIKKINDFICSRSVGQKDGLPWPALGGKDNELKLKESQQILIGTQLLQRKQNRASFLLDDAALKEKKKCLRSNLDQLEEIANSRYRDFRTKVEYTFRQELLGHIENHKRDANFFKEYISHVLKRMREFWAFKAAYLACYSFETEEISIIAKSVFGKGENGFGYPGNLKGKLSLNVRHDQLHPDPHLYRKKDDKSNLKPPYDKIVPQANKIIEEDKGDLKVFPEDYIFLVLIPSYKEVYTFVFAVRDKNAICSLKHPNSNSISAFCQDIILDVCSEVVYEFYNVPSFYESHKQALEEEQNKRAEQIKEVLGAISIHLQGEPDKEYLTRQLEKINSITIVTIQDPGRAKRSDASVAEI